MSAEETQGLRIMLFGVTVVVLSLLLLSRRLTVSTAYILMAIYIGWMGYVFYDTLIQSAPAVASTAAPIINMMGV
jgi:hypothetical protein